MKTINAPAIVDQPVTEDLLQQAIQRGRARQRQGVHATDVHYLAVRKLLLIGFADHCALALPVNNFPELASLSLPELKRLSIGLGGCALCLEERDLHLSIAGLITASQPLLDMASSVVAAHHGSRSSQAKASAARANGKKGGRPRKLVVS